MNTSQHSTAHSFAILLQHIRLYWLASFVHCFRIKNSQCVTVSWLGTNRMDKKKTTKWLGIVASRHWLCTYGRRYFSFVFITVNACVFVLKMCIEHIFESSWNVKMMLKKHFNMWLQKKKQVNLYNLLHFIHLKKSVCYAVLVSKFIECV